jgi:hypothetical protein
METKHTPGPWAIERLTNGAYPRTVITHQTNYRACIVADLHNASLNGEAEANARLIAAAPELLAALEKIDANAAESVAWIRRVAGGAIAKAKGADT